MTEPPPLPTPRRIWPTFLLGIFAANLIGGILFILLFKFIGVHKESDISVLAVPNLFLVPFIAGLVAAWFWRKLNRTISIRILDSLGTSLLSRRCIHSSARRGSLPRHGFSRDLGNDLCRYSGRPLVIQPKHDGKIAAQHFPAPDFADGWRFRLRSSDIDNRNGRNSDPRPTGKSLAARPRISRNSRSAILLDLSARSSLSDQDDKRRQLRWRGSPMYFQRRHRDQGTRG